MSMKRIIKLLGIFLITSFTFFTAGAQNGKGNGKAKGKSKDKVVIYQNGTVVNATGTARVLPNGKVKSVPPGWSKGKKVGWTKGRGHKH
jgi:hypothetical protein